MYRKIFNDSNIKLTRSLKEGNSSLACKDTELVYTSGTEARLKAILITDPSPP